MEVFDDDPVRDTDEIEAVSAVVLVLAYPTPRRARDCMALALGHVEFRMKLRRGGCPRLDFDKDEYLVFGVEGNRIDLIQPK